VPDELFWEIHSELPREGPGDNASTRRAFAMMDSLSDQAKILDVACGPGMQTMELARLSDGHITALDFHPPFLKEVERRASEAGIAARVTTVHASMMDMPLDREFDAIWCEGAMYIMGPRAALTQWKRYLKPRGYIAFTEPCFLTDTPSAEVMKLWINDYPGMGNIENTKKIIEETGYELLGHFTIPDSAWWDDYYTPQEARLKMLREKYRDAPDKLKTIEETQAEIDMHRKYSQYYGYVFFVVQSKTG
jgi:ubiquinone/menaquinone biosynthesis C-methylase UbiE